MPKPPPEPSLRPRSAKVRVGIIGDYDPKRVSHLATEEALEQAEEALSVAVEYAWLPTPSLDDAYARKTLSAFGSLWCAPSSPYRSLDGPLTAISIVREANIPLLGTCGGFQHVVLEYARNVLGLESQHGEYIAGTPDPFVAPLACSLVGQAMQVRLTPGSNVHRFYAQDEVTEEYRCSFGVRREYQQLPNEGGCASSAWIQMARCAS